MGEWITLYSSQYVWEPCVLEQCGDIVIGFVGAIQTPHSQIFYSIDKL
jgi:hypothetical protein